MPGARPDVTKRDHGRSTRPAVMVRAIASAAGLRRLPLSDNLTLGDVAQVELTHAERFSAFHGNGKPAIAIAIQRAPGESVQINEALVPVPKAAVRAKFGWKPG